MANKVTIGLIQMNCGENREKNFEKSSDLIRDAAKRGAEIICLPELFLSTYFCQAQDDRFFSFAESVPGKTTDFFSKIAKETKTVLVISLYERANNGKYFNTAVVLNADGKYLGKYRKIHIPDDAQNGYGERFYFSDGDLGIQVFQTKFGKIAPLVCFDQWFPEAARMCAEKGAEIIFYPTAIGWPQKDRAKLNRLEHSAWQVMQRSHAIANNVFVAACNRVGLEQGLKFWGTSFVSDPYGHVIAKAPSDQETILIAQCDFQIMNDMKKDWPFLKEKRIAFSV